ncbi:hypothetical protein SLE2022_120420 [Rubroshorea leprosula]
MVTSTSRMLEAEGRQRIPAPRQHASAGAGGGGLWLVGLVVGYSHRRSHCPHRKTLGTQRGSATQPHYGHYESSRDGFGNSSSPLTRSTLLTLHSPPILWTVGLS